MAVNSIEGRDFVNKKDEIVKIIFFPVKCSQFKDKGSLISIKSFGFMKIEKRRYGELLRGPRYLGIEVLKMNISALCQN